MMSALAILVAARSSYLLGRQGDLTATQAAHSTPTPRIGGVAIFTACMLMMAFAPDSVAGRYVWLVAALLPVFFAGFLEDLGFRVSPVVRLFVSLAASTVIVAALGTHINRDPASWLTSWVSLPAIGIPVTLLVTAGLTNAFNMIDGMNGLCGLAAIVGALGMAAIGTLSGYEGIVPLAVMFAGAVAGFLVLNFPSGRLFLGDAGAYSIGFVLAWFGVSLVYRTETISVWAVGLVLLWPIADMLWAILRRIIRGRATMLPDRMHFHQLVMRLIRLSDASPWLRRHANPATTVILAPLMVVPALIGVSLWNAPSAALLSFVGCLAVYVALYVALVRLAPRLRRRRTCVRPAAEHVPA